MSRPPATTESEQRVRALVDGLFRGVDEDASLQALARDAGLEYETVRSLLRPTPQRLRVGPGFMVVASLARARGISLDQLADAVPGMPPIRQAAGADARIPTMGGAE